MRARRPPPVLLVAALVGALGCGQRGSPSLDCRFLPVEVASDEVPDCARTSAGGAVTLTERGIAAVAERGPGPVAVSIEGTLHYANAAGRVVPVLPFDNGADYFVEGLARTRRDGQIGFVDRDLVVRIPPAWDFAFPFEGGFAMVCRGCRIEPDGEHRAVRGGRWGWIDPTGAEVVPVRHAREALPPRPARQEARGGGMPNEPGTFVGSYLSPYVLEVLAPQERTDVRAPPSPGRLPWI